MKTAWRRARPFMGYKIAGGREVFRSAVEPTRQSHGHLYCAVVGPFNTMRAARFMASWRAVANPHVRCVADAERISAEIERKFHVTESGAETISDMRG